MIFSLWSTSLASLRLTAVPPQLQEPVRPELMRKIGPDKWRQNPITGVREPHVSGGIRALYGFLSSLAVLFMVSGTRQK